MSARSAERERERARARERERESEKETKGGGGVEREKVLCAILDNAENETCRSRCTQQKPQEIKACMQRRDRPPCAGMCISALCELGNSILSCT